MLDALLWVLTREEIQAVHVFSQTRCFVFRFLIRGARCSHETQEKVISKIQTLFSREWGHPGNWLFGHSDEMEEIKNKVHPRKNKVFEDGIRSRRPSL